jgi:hypothetical protein
MTRAQEKLTKDERALLRQVADWLRTNCEVLGTVESWIAVLEKAGKPTKRELQGIHKAITRDYIAFDKMPKTEAAKLAAQHIDEAGSEAYGGTVVPNDIKSLVANLSPSHQTPKRRTTKKAAKKKK